MRCLHLTRRRSQISLILFHLKFLDSQSYPGSCFFSVGICRSSLFSCIIPYGWDGRFYSTTTTTRARITIGTFFLPFSMEWMVIVEMELVSSPFDINRVSFWHGNLLRWSRRMPTIIHIDTQLSGPFFFIYIYIERERLPGWTVTGKNELDNVLWQGEGNKKYERPLACFVSFSGDNRRSIANNNHNNNNSILFSCLVVSPHSV